MQTGRTVFVVALLALSVAACGERSSTPEPQAASQAEPAPSIPDAFTLVESVGKDADARVSIPYRKFDTKYCGNPKNSRFCGLSR